MVVHQPAEAVAPGSTTASFTVNNPKDIYKYEYISHCKVFKNLAYVYCTLKKYYTNVYFKKYAMFVDQLIQLSF